MKKIKFLTITTVMFSAVVLFSSCSKKAAVGHVYSDSVPQYSKQSKVTNSAIATRAMKTDFIAEEAIEMESAEIPAYENDSANDYASSRKLIKNGNIDIEVENFDTIEKDIQDYANNNGGYITNTYSSGNSMNVTIKIPCDKFDQAMSVVSSMGKVRYRSENSQDVTDEYYDLESRIETKKILQNKMESYLKQATNLSDLLEVERQLNEVISELESYEGRMKRLSNQIEYSTIYLNVSLPVGRTETGYDLPDLGDNFKELGYNILSFLAWLLMAIIYVLIFGIPLLAIGAFLYWLLFGRIGLLVKLFKFLSKKKN